MDKQESDRLIDLLGAFSGVRIKHGEYRVVVKRGAIDSVQTILSTVVDVNEEGANNAPNSKAQINATAKKAKEEPKC